MSQSFSPPERILMGPGPSDIHPRVLQALSRPTIGHLDPQFIVLMESIKTLLQYAFQTSNPLTLPLSAPGSAGMEACFANLLEPGDEVLICQNGVFGGRMLENAKRMGAEVTLISESWGHAVNPEKVEKALKSNPKIKVLAFVHGETSTGVLSDAKTLCKIAKEYDTLSLVDAVTSLVGSQVEVDDWEIDAIYSGSQKCLSCTPGLSPLSFSHQASSIIKQRKSPVQSWFLDMNLIMGYWQSGSKRSYHHTAPIHMLYALHESLTMLQEEGLGKTQERHKLMHRAFAAGIEQLGLSFKVEPQLRLPQLNAISVPEKIDETKVRNQLLQDFGIEIGAGLGELSGKVWRIGLMGSSCKPQRVYQCLNALGVALSQQGFKTDCHAAIKAAKQVLQNIL